MTPEAIELAFQELYDEALKIQATARENNAATSEAAARIQALHIDMPLRLAALSSQVLTVARQWAGETSQGTAALLSAHFAEADDAAHRAARRYEKAARKLNFRIIAAAAVVQVLIFLGVWLFVQQTVPSISDIEARKSLLKEMESQVSMLEQRGGALELVLCSDSKKRDRWCVRTDEAGNSWPLKREGEKGTYRVIYGH